MNRRRRVALELLAPPIMGAVALSPFAVFRGIGDVALLLALAYLYAGLPSVAYAMAMELAFSTGIKPASWACVGISTALGALAGGAVLMLPNPHTFTLDGFGTFGSVGLLVGAALGGWIRLRSMRVVAAV